MGVIETVIQYNREEAEELGKQLGEKIGKEIGKEIGEIITKLRGKLDLLFRFKDRNFSNEDLAEMGAVKHSFVRSFKSGYTTEKYKDLLLAIEKSETLDDLKILKHFLIKSMHQFGFSKIALVEYFAMKNKEIEKIIKEK